MRVFVAGSTGAIGRGSGRSSKGWGSEPTETPRTGQGAGPPSQVDRTNGHRDDLWISCCSDGLRS